MLGAVEETARWTTAKIRTIRDLMQVTADHVRRTAPALYSRELVELIIVQPYMSYGVQLAELGYVVLCPRNFLYLRSPGGSWESKVQDVRNCYPQWKGITRMVYDAMRAVDVLQSFAFVDPSRIGCIGHSLGAKEVLYAAAFDRRYKVAIFSEGGIGFAEPNTNWNAEWYLGCTFEQINMDHHELLALISPRPFLLLAGGTLTTPTPPLPPRIRKGTDDERSWKYIKAAMPVYDLLGHPKNTGWLHHNKGHDYPQEAQDVTREFVIEHLPPP
jgi:dienelactone hydrolase